MRIKPRILVIDDEAIVCKSCKKILATEDYEVESTTSPKGGHREGRPRGNYDLVLSDIKMPGSLGHGRAAHHQGEIPWDVRDNDFRLLDPCSPRWTPMKSGAFGLRAETVHS